MSFSLDVNLLGGTSFTIGYDTYLDENEMQTTGVTIGINTGLLAVAVAIAFALAWVPAFAIAILGL